MSKKIYGIHMKQKHIKMLIGIFCLTLLIQFGSNTSASEPVLDKFVYLPMVVRPNADLRITFISFAPSNGESQVDSEYVTITNVDNAAQNMTGWVLHDEGENFEYTFSEFTLQPDTSINVWSQSGTDTQTNLYWFEIGRTVWNNTGDTATLKDIEGVIIDTCSYTEGGSSVSCN